ncbi:ral-GDS-related protein-like [Equus quagga]|uniref:ral-GDS-related protein-like n=1 Tax=Equus quagga TaxID=89248 RepID=UPI001EE24B5A|nr:ral-GDS-related protein-like [Equus quagga]
MPSSPLGHMEAAWPIACGTLEDRTTSQKPAPKLLPLPEPEPVPAPGLEPAAPPVSPRVVELEPAAPESATPGPEQGPPVKAAPEPSCPWAVTTEDQLWEEKPNILDFPPQLVAEQMTRMAAVSRGARRAGGPCLPGAMSHPTPAIPCSGFR